MATIRIKLIVQPYDERLCILVNTNSTIADLKGRVFDAIQFYSIYKDFLDFCTIHLELKIKDDLYFIPENYVLSDCYDSNDIFVVTFIENKQYQNRQSIHMKYQTKSDIQTIKKTNVNLSPSLNRSFNISSNLNKNIASNFDDGTSNIHDIKEWIISYLNNHGTLHAIYRAEYSKFIDKLQQTFANSIQNIFNLHSIRDFESFLIQQCSIELIKTQNGYNISYESPAIKNKYKNKKNPKNKNKSNKNKPALNKAALHPVLQNINNQNNKQRQVRQPRRQPPPIPTKKNIKNIKNIKNKNNNNKNNLYNKNNKNNKNEFIPNEKKKRNEIETIKILSPPKPANKKEKEEFPTTPDSPSDDNDDNDDSDDTDGNNEEKNEVEKNEDENYNTRKSPPPHHRPPPPQQQVKESPQKPQIQPKPKPQPPKSQPQPQPEEKAEPKPKPEEKAKAKAEAKVDVEEADTKVNTAVAHGQRVPEITEVYNITDVRDDDMSGTKPITSRGEEIIALLPDILLTCYKMIGTKYVLLNELERLIKTSFRENTPYKFDIVELDYVCFQQLLLQIQLKMNINIVHIEKKLMDKNCNNDIKNGKCPEIETYVVINGNNSVEDPAEISENIKYLSACNVVTKLSPNDVFYHLKLIHSQCAVDKLLDGVGGVQNMSMMNINSFDEIAGELRENNISGARVLEMKWSDWEMLHELSRFDRDHQDFVEDIVMDFFFPFITGEQLSNQIVNYNQNQNEISIFNQEQLRSKFTLCIDYGLFYNDANNTIAPIFHYFVKKCQLMDCNRLLLLHKNISVDCVMGEYSSMHIAAWRGKFKLLAYLTNYGGNPLLKNKKGETAFQAGRKYRQKLKWYFAQFPQYKQLGQ